jgi:hypothetical protein
MNWHLVFAGTAFGVATLFYGAIGYSVGDIFQ